MNSVRALLVLEGRGQRVFAWYYGSEKRTPEWAKRAMEKQIMQKAAPLLTLPAPLELGSAVAVVQRGWRHLLYVVVGDRDENELLLLDLLATFATVLDKILLGVTATRIPEVHCRKILLAVDDLVGEGGTVLTASADDVLAQLPTDDVEEDAYQERK